MGIQADQVRDDILDKVQSRRLLPGDRIDENELRHRLSLSGTPVREALIPLETSGVIERRPRDGARITSLDLEGLMKMVEVLAEAEGSVAYLAAPLIVTHRLPNLKAAARACEQYASGKGNQSADYYDLNLDFHRALIAAAGNEHMEQSVFNTGNRLVAYLSARHNLPGEHLRSANEHRDICDAVLTANADLARRLMLDHVTFSHASALDVINMLNSA